MSDRRTEPPKSVQIGPRAMTLIDWLEFSARRQGVVEGVQSALVAIREYPLAIEGVDPRALALAKTHLSMALEMHLDLLVNPEGMGGARPSSPRLQPVIDRISEVYGTDGSLVLSAD